MRTIEAITAQLASIRAAADATALAAIYADLIGYNPLDEEAGTSADSLRGTLFDYIRELCFDAGIHVADVGLTDADRCTVHYFTTTGEAYDACMCRDDIKTGDTVVVPTERVVGVAETWPFAVTASIGQLHGMSAQLTDEAFVASAASYGSRLTVAHLQTARAIAASLGF